VKNLWPRPRLNLSSFSGPTGSQLHVFGRHKNSSKMLDRSICYFLFGTIKDMLSNL